jgi:hypothetical protein
LYLPLLFIATTTIDWFYLFIYFVITSKYAHVLQWGNNYCVVDGTRAAAQWSLVWA